MVVLPFGAEARGNSFGTISLLEILNSAANLRIISEITQISHSFLSGASLPPHIKIY